MAMESSTGRILQEILEYLPVLKVPARERLLLKDGGSAWVSNYGMNSLIAIESYGGTLLHESLSKFGPM